jgi:hypothetical protein
VDEHPWLTLHVGREAIAKVRPGGSLVFLTGTLARRAGTVLSIAGTAASSSSLTRPGDGSHARI